jgi:multiple sugar transport system substrate-binding protein
MHDSSQKLSRRTFLKATGFGAATIMLAACAPVGQPGAAPAGEGGAAAPAAEPVQLDFFAWGDASDIPAWDELAMRYMEMNPNATVKPSPTPNDADYYTKMQTQFAGGFPPHVASFQGWEWQPYADKDLLAPIDEYAVRDNFSAPYPEDVNSIELTTRRGGKRYLIPTQVATMVMFYAKKHFDEAGIPYPTDDWTFEQFLDIAQKLSKSEGDSKRYGYQPNGSWYRDIHWIRSTGKQEFDELSDPKKAMFDQPEIVEIVQLIAQDFRYKMNVSPTPADQASGANTIDTGNCAMKYEGPWYFPTLNNPDLRKDNKQVDFDVVLMPKGKDENRPHRGWSEGVVLPKTDRVDAAWGFVSFMGGEEGQKIYSGITGRLPNTTALIESFWLPTAEEKFGVKNGKALIEAFKRSEVDVVGGVPRSVMWNQVVKPAGWDPINNNSATAAEALPKVTEGVQALLDEYWASKG